MDPLKCYKNNPRWDNKSYSPWDISLLRNHNPCKGCDNRKACATTEERPKGKKIKFKKPPVVKGELLNASGKRQMGLKRGIVLDSRGDPQIDKSTWTPVIGLVKVQYVRTRDAPGKVDRAL